MCNCHHPGPRRVWDGGSEPEFLTPLARLCRLPRLRWRVPKTQILLLYASLQSSRPPATLSCCLQAAELVRVTVIPSRREHREINVRQKALRFWKTFVLPDGTKRIIFTTNSTLRDDLDVAFSGAQWVPIRAQSRVNWSQLDLNQVGPTGPQYIHKLPINRLKRPICYHVELH